MFDEYSAGRSELDENWPNLPNQCGIGLEVQMALVGPPTMGALLTPLA